MGGALCGRDRVIALGWVFVGEGQRRPGLSQVPDEVAGEQADQHVGFDAVLEAVVDGPQVQVVGLDDAEVAFDVGEVLVALDDRGGVEGVGVDAGAQHVDAVQGGLGVDAGLVATVGEGGVGDGGVEVLAHLVFVDHLAHRLADLARAGEGAAADPVGDAGEQLVGCGQQVAAFAGTFGGERGCGTRTSSLSGVLPAASSMSDTRH